jgi:hypothetical protein
MTEKKRGRPKKEVAQIWERKYYFLSEARNDQAIRKVLEERMFKGFEEVHILAFDKPIGWFEINVVKKQIGVILDTI